MGLPHLDAGLAREGSQEIEAPDMGSSKQTLRQELKDKQLIWEMKEITRARGGENETGKAVKEACYQAS